MFNRFVADVRAKLVPAILGEGRGCHHHHQIYSSLDSLNLQEGFVVLIFHKQMHLKNDPLV